MIYDDAFLYRLFSNRCVQCTLQRATEINHIVPRSEDRSLINDWHNKVPMCHTCHTAYHQGGVTDAKIAKLKEAREHFLTVRGLGEYI